MSAQNHDKETDQFTAFIDLLAAQAMARVNKLAHRAARNTKEIAQDLFAEPTPNLSQLEEKFARLTANSREICALYSPQSALDPQKIGFELRPVSKAWDSAFPCFPEGKTLPIFRHIYETNLLRKLGDVTAEILVEGAPQTQSNQGFLSVGREFLDLTKTLRSPEKARAVIAHVKKKTGIKETISEAVSRKITTLCGSLLNSAQAQSKMGEIVVRAYGAQVAFGHEFVPPHQALEKFTQSEGSILKKMAAFCWGLKSNDPNIIPSEEIDPAVLVSTIDTIRETAGHLFCEKLASLNNLARDPSYITKFSPSERAVATDYLMRDLQDLLPLCITGTSNDACVVLTPQASFGLERHGFILTQDKAGQFKLKPTCEPANSAAHQSKALRRANPSAA